MACADLIGTMSMLNRPRKPRAPPTGWQRSMRWRWLRSVQSGRRSGRWGEKGSHLSEDELQELRELDKSYRKQMTEMHDSHDELQGAHRSAHEEARKKSTRNIKVMALGALDALAQTIQHRRKRGADGPAVDSPSVCFLQWAFTQNPEAWCPPPAADLKHAMVLAEQRAQLALAVRQLLSAMRQLPGAAAQLHAAVELQRDDGHRDGGDETNPKQFALGARLMRRALMRILWKQGASFFQRLMVFRSELRAVRAAQADGSPSKRSVGALGVGPSQDRSQANKIAAPKHKARTQPAMLEEHAALKIQSAERGRRARRRVKQVEHSLSPPVATERGSIKDVPPPSHLPDLPPVPQEVQEAAATKIQSTVRGRKGRQMAQQQRRKVFSRRSALKLQAKGPQAPEVRPSVTQAAAVPVAQRPRRSAEAKRLLDAWRWWPNRQASLGHLPPPPEVQQSAAVTIQRATRNHQGRRALQAQGKAARQSEDFDEGEEAGERRDSVFSKE
ncbi:unnamed protein product [Durusdinium trenchii]|uniref:Uncharacterized protein n=1 Tax=Durusdinium trenchii TaxID=1381693 RepID=A0ABP0ILM2_9DINO